MIVVSDTSPITNLIKIEKLHLLQTLYHEVLIPPVVYAEILALEQFNFDLTGFRQSKWIRKEEPKDKKFVALLEEKIDPGEAQAIALAREVHADLIIIDERDGFNAAYSLGIKGIGLLGIVRELKMQGVIPSAKGILDQLRNDAGFWISEKLYLTVLNSVNEK
jgi:predicted nucleic acid-binding protein